MSEKIKGKLNSNAKFRDTVNLLKSGRFDFQIIRSNYTIEVKSEMFNFKLNTKERTGSFFGAKHKITKDIEQVPELVKSLMDKARPNYCNIWNLHDLKNRTVYAFDISGAYPKVLYFEGVISKETFTYLMSIKKEDRLPAIGTIASKKTAFYYYDGALEDIEIFESKYNNLFFYVVGKTDQIIKDISHKLGVLKLFSWVDCIYIDVTELTPEEREIKTDTIFKEFEQIYFNVKMEVLNDFNCTEKEKHFKLEYHKAGKIKPSYMIVPKDESRAIKNLHFDLFGFY